MPRKPSAKRYAEAAFELAVEREQVERWVEQVSGAAEALSQPETVTSLQTPRLPLERRLGLMDHALPAVEREVRNLVALLVVRQRLSLLPRVADELRRLADRHAGVVRARVRAPVTLEPSEQERIAGWLEGLLGAGVRMEVEEDPGVLGGFVARAGDKMVDASARTRLLQLRQALVEGAA